MKKEKILISSCLLGDLVKYNGHHNKIENNLLNKLQTKYEILGFCPEVSGGLPTPRIPCEIVSFHPYKVINKTNEDKTKEFLFGAKNTLSFCKKNNIKKAVLKSNSPSCSNEYIYNGKFNGEKIKAMGITADLLTNNGIRVFNETQLKELFLLHNVN